MSLADDGAARLRFHATVVLENFYCFAVTLYFNSYDVITNAAPLPQIIFTA